MKELLKPPTLYWMIGIFVVYSMTNIILSEFYITVQYIPYYLDTIHWSELLVSTLLFLAIGFRISVNSVMTYKHYTERKSAAKGGFMTCVATIGGLATGVCSACTIGAIPLALSSLGITAGFASLPFKGIEIQLAVLGILIVNYFFLLNK